MKNRPTQKQQKPMSNRIKESRKGTKEAFSYKIKEIALLYLVCLIQRVKPFPPAGKCWFQEETSEITLTGVQNDPNAKTVNLQCGAGTNTFHFSAWVYADDVGPVDQYRIIFAYHNEFTMSFNGGGKNKLRFTRSGVKLIERPVGEAERWVFVIMQVTPDNISFPYRATHTYDLEEGQKYQIALSPQFSYQSSPNNVYHIGKHQAANEYSFSGKISRAMFSCDTIPFELFLNFRILPSMVESRLRAAYLFDFNSQQFSNLARKEKQPLAYRGDGNTVEASDPVLVSTPSNHFQVTNGKHFKIGAVDYGFQTNLYTVSHVLKIKFSKFPKPGEREPVYTFLTDKTMPFVFGYDKKFTIGSAASKFTTPEINFILGTWYHIRFTFTRLDYVTPYLDCSVSVQVLEIAGAEYGHDLKCSTMDTRSGGAFGIIESKIGGSTVTGGALSFEVASLFVFRGLPTLLDTTTSSDCSGAPAGNNPCQLLVTNTKEDVCLKCSTSGSNKWFFGQADDQILCNTGATTSHTKPASFYTKNLYTTCNIGKYVSSPGTCSVCDSTCSSCSAAGSTSCLSCYWDTGKYLSSGHCSSTCDTTPGNNKYDAFGRCNTCPAECTTCPLGDCAVCTGHEVHIKGACRDLKVGFYDLQADGWDTCHEGCATCYDTLGEHCLSCKPGSYFFKEDSRCVSDCNTEAGKWIRQAGNSYDCIDCDANCAQCLVPTFCLRCASGYTPDSSGTCVQCATASANFINNDNYPLTCDSCSPNCLQCSDYTTCTSCASGFKESSGLCVLDCGANCVTCASSTVCAVCDTASHYHLAHNSCHLCDVSRFLKVFNPVPNPPTCEACQGNCATCETTPDNCKSCSSGFQLTLNQGTGKNECVSSNQPGSPVPNFPQASCDSTCATCVGSEARDCRTCPSSTCLTILGSCSTCPPNSVVITDQDSIIQNANLTWLTKQIDVNDVYNYKIDFSEDEISFDPRYDLYDLMPQITVDLAGYRNQTDYTYKISWAKEKGLIHIGFSFLVTIKPTNITTTFVNPEYLTSQSGKKLANKEHTMEFQGYNILPKQAKEVIEVISKVSKPTTGAAYYGGIAALSFSSLFSDMLAGASKLIQIIEFSCMMENFNFDYDPVLGYFLSNLTEITNFDVIKPPFESTVSSTWNSVAAQWKGKLSELEIKPYVLQELGYPGVILLLIYIVQALLILMRVNTPRMLSSFRVAVSNSLLVDYLSVSFRTLGHHPTMVHHPRGDYPSFILAHFFVGCFTIELILMLKLCNSERFVNKEELSKTENSLWQVYFDGMEKSVLKTSWFARNYNFMFNVRFCALCWLIHNLQYLQIPQAVVSLLLFVVTAVLAFYYQFSEKIFDTTTTAVFRLVQEVSMAVMLLLVNIFCLDSFKRRLTSEFKAYSLVVFIILLVANIFLEITALLISFFHMLRTACQTKQRGKNPQKQKKEVKKTNPSRVAPMSSHRGLKNPALPSTNFLDLPVAGGVSDRRPVDISFKNNNKRRP